MLFAKRVISFWLLLLLVSCVTINVYFPAAAAEKAADRIIDEVWGQRPDEAPRDQVPQPQPQTKIERPIAEALLGFLVPNAHAQDFDVSTPAIEAIKASMKARHDQLLPFYQAGAIGLTGDGLLDVHDLKIVALKDRKALSQLVAAENRDRQALYQEIAQANGHPEWMSNIRDTFSERWVSKAPAGWWYNQGGTWRQK